MSILNEAVSWFFRKRISRIDEFRKNPIDTQEKQFQYLLEQGKETFFGKKYEFRSISNYSEFCQRVPLHSYEEFFPYIEKTLKGEQNIIWNSRIDWFSKSSGTTNAKSKFIPVSKESLENCNYVGGRDILTLYLENVENSKIFDGKTIGMGGSFVENPYQKGVKNVGDISAIIMNHLPIWAELLRSPDLETALMGEWEQKIEKIARMTSQENITSIFGVPSWTLVLLEKVIALRSAQNALEFWGNFELFCHGGISFLPYQQQFKTQIFPSENVRYIEVYNASEGFFGIQDDLSLPEELLLLLDYGVFYEFIPLEEIETESPKILSLQDVEIGRTYALVITTNAGLWRYKIGDTIEFTSRNPFRFKISGRTQQFINAFGEELMVNNAERAIEQASSQTQARVRDYTVAPYYIENQSLGGHQWLIEFEHAPENISVFMGILDESLKLLNSDYEAKRYKNMVLLPPKIENLPQGTFYTWLKMKNKVGGQNKVPRLSNSRAYVEQLLSLLHG